jgi:hypothetical protein
VVFLEEESFEPWLDVRHARIGVGAWIRNEVVDARPWHCPVAPPFLIREALMDAMSVSALNDSIPRPMLRA